jgi:hypothetical protein
MPRNRFQIILKFLYVFDHSRNVSRQECFLAVAALALIILLA